jgi:hypothetical protein
MVLQTMNQTSGEIKDFFNVQCKNELRLTLGKPLLGKCLQMVTRRSPYVCQPDERFTRNETPPIT